MIHRRVLLPVFAASLFAVACGQDPPPPPPEPMGPTQEQLDSMRRDSIMRERARLDSIAEAEAAAERERMRAEAIADAVSTLEEMVFFDYDESEIRSDAEMVLRQKAQILQASPAVRIRIEGHADERGSTEYNVALGNRRAQSVVDFFTSFGLDASRFTITSYGEERPLAQGSNEAAWARNRRAEFVITAGRDQINPGM